MYRESSPIFDIPKFPTLRRVKPLPKRRRTSDNNQPPPDVAHVPALTLPALSPDATPQEIVAHAEALSAQMALQSYYMPILGGVQDLLKSANEANRIDFGALGDAGRSSSREDEDDDAGDGDYVDHLQQPGNTKKRKVPANISHSSHGGHDAEGNSGGEEESQTERLLPARFDPDAAEVIPSSVGPKPRKMSKATKAGLQHKEILKSRKKQLAAVLSALSQGDTLALDQALLSTYPFSVSVDGNVKHDVPKVRLSLPKVRLSRRLGPRLARAGKAAVQALPSSSGKPFPFPESEFTFSCRSATSDRLVATKEEVTMLRERFEAELTRQAAKAAKIAAASKLMSSPPPKGVRTKRSERAQQRVRTAGLLGGKGDLNAEFLDPAHSGSKSKGNKKKRSALANASNPHHLRNYVPSRLPHSGQANVSQAHNYLGPFPLRFLSAEIPTRGGTKGAGNIPASHLTNPSDEWICLFCEYRLFYGDEQSYRRSVRLRKKILKRRRRARERAAAAASGNNLAKAPEKSSLEDYDAPFDAPVGDYSTSKSSQGKWKGESSRAEEKDGYLQSSSFG